LSGNTETASETTTHSSVAKPMGAATTPDSSAAPAAQAKQAATAPDAATAARSTSGPSPPIAGDASSQTTEAPGRNAATGQVGMPLPSSTPSAGPTVSSAAAAVTTSSTSSTGEPAFDPAYVTVVYVLGGPGAGKGTQCAKLVAEKDFVHLSAGDLLRAEQNREGSKVGQMIKDYIKEGKIVPSEVTIGLLRSAMQERKDKDGKNRFLIDGFPRQMDQAIQFDDTVCPGSAVLFLTCPEETLLERLLERGKTSGRDDDNAESIKKRFRTFIETSMPVVDYYRKLGKVIDVNSSKSIDAVYHDISVALDSLQRRKSLSLEGQAA